MLFFVSAARDWLLIPVWLARHLVVGSINLRSR
jgi:hypothetical protein